MGIRRANHALQAFDAQYILFFLKKIWVHVCQYDPICTLNISKTGSFGSLIHTFPDSPGWLCLHSCPPRDRSEDAASARRRAVATTMICSCSSAFMDLAAKGWSSFKVHGDWETTLDLDVLRFLKAPKTSKNRVIFCPTCFGGCFHSHFLGQQFQWCWQSFWVSEKCDSPTEDNHCFQKRQFPLLNRNVPSEYSIPRWPWKPARHEPWLFITSLLGRTIAERDLPGDLAMGHYLWLPQMRCLDFCSFEYHCQYHYKCSQRDDLPGRVHICASFEMVSQCFHFNISSSQHFQCLGKGMERKQMSCLALRILREMPISPTRHAANVVFPDIENTGTRTTYKQGYIIITHYIYICIYVYIYIYVYMLYRTMI